MDNKIKIVFVDIDWTIFDHSKQPSKFDKRSIKELQRIQKKGVLVFLCTARPYHSVAHIKLLDIFTPDGMILANGGLVVYKNDILYEDKMNPKELEDFCDLATSLQVNVEVIRPFDCFLIAPENKVVISLFAVYPEPIPPVEDYHNQKEVIGCNLFAPIELDEIFKAKLPKDFYYFRYHDFGVDIGSTPHVKGDAIRITLNKLNIDKKCAMAIGDDYADISMFENVEYGIAMGNAREEVKDAASHITKTVTRHGVKHILRQFIK